MNFWKRPACQTMPKPLDRSATSQVAPDLLPSLVSVSGTTARGSVVGQ